MTLQREIEAITEQIAKLDASRPKLTKRNVGIAAALTARWRKDPPPPTQMSLFRSLQDDLQGSLLKIMAARQTVGARVRLIAKKHKVPLPEAGKAYKKTLARLTHDLQYKHYIDNKDYVDWLDTPEYREYCQTYLDLIDKRKYLWEQDFAQRVAAGTEHVIAIVYTPELAVYLDWPVGSGSYHGPMSHAVQRMTEHDARILWVSKAMALVEGDESTLFNHAFITKDSLRGRADFARVEEQEQARIKCACGAVLDYNTVGFNRKLGTHPYQCVLCLDVSQEYVNSVCKHYRSAGCTMFI